MFEQKGFGVPTPQEMEDGEDWDDEDSVLSSRGALAAHRPSPTHSPEVCVWQGVLRRGVAGRSSMGDLALGPNQLSVGNLPPSPVQHPASKRGLSGWRWRLRGCTCLQAGPPTL